MHERFYVPSEECGNRMEGQEGQIGKRERGFGDELSQPGNSGYLPPGLVKDLNYNEESVDPRFPLGDHVKRLSPSPQRYCVKEYHGQLY